MMRSVTFYRTAAGRCPVAEFLDSLPPKDAQKVTWVLKLVEELEEVPLVYFKKLQGTEGIWECRATFGSKSYRIFCFFAGDHEVVLTHGAMKKRQKTPRGEIEKAQGCRRDYLTRRKP